ncbi:3-oxo-5-alpha-steroid 4-dehydrogenase-domain-containing protein [Spinellus fusiger]|nr:3-oxo-5-alpha-steroid 4-dehydrogenase-domain-containing protein [Spinellus fusiger]
MFIHLHSTSSLLIIAAYFIGGTKLILRELNPTTQLGYSKFNRPGKKFQVSSRNGMLVIYTPAFIISLLCLVYAKYQSINIYSQLAVFSLCIHFTKRIYEVLSVHRYSGNSSLLDAMIISTGYLLLSTQVLYWVYQVPVESIVPSQVMTGFLLFLLGEGINYYHHLLLANLRKDGSKEYKIPTQGLFHYLWCPHYSGEILALYSVALMSQNALSFFPLLFSSVYICFRAYSTRLWYMEKFPNSSKKACLIPNVF